MRKLLLIFVFFALCYTAVFAQAVQNAAEKYNAGDYLAAAELYRQALKDDTENPYILYNLANSYFKAGDADKALVYYWRAFNILPRDGDIRHNLAFAMKSTGQTFIPEDIPQSVFVFYNYFSFAELKGFCAVFVWLFSLLLIVYLLSGKKKSIRFLSSICFFVFVFFAVWTAARYSAASSRLAVVTAARAELRSGPGDNFPVSLSVPRAHLLSVEDSKGDWYLVNLKDAASKGWVLKKSIEEI